MDSGQRHKFIQQLLKLASDPERRRLATDLFNDHMAATSPSSAEPKPVKKLATFWSSTPIWGGIGLLGGFLASQLSSKLLFVAVCGIFIFEFVRVGFFSGKVKGIVGNLVAGALFAVLFVGLYRVLPKPKESPTLDQQADVVIDKVGRKFPWLTSPPPKIETPPLRVIVSAEPKLQFSVKRDRTIVLDNSKGSDLQDFKLDALEYYLDGKSFANNHAKVTTRTIYGGDLDFKHFDLPAGKIKLFRPTEYLRYGLLLNWHRPSQDALQTFDSMVHYYCLRFVFTEKKTGETFVHYVVISPYSDQFDYVGSPEASSGQEQAGDEGFPFSIARNIKADARNFYGTEYREYQP